MITTDGTSSGLVGSRLQIDSCSIGSAPSERKLLSSVVPSRVRGLACLFNTHHVASAAKPVPGLQVVVPWSDLRLTVWMHTH